MTVLTGATGGLGSEVLKHLLQLVPASSLVVSSPDPSKVPEHIARAGVHVRHGDFAKPDTLAAAFAGADKLLVVSYPGIAHGQRVQMHKNAIDAAKRAGVKHVYYTSLAFDPAGASAVMRAHRDTEAYLKESGLTYTIIREGIYSESYPLYFGFFRAESEDADVYVPGDGGIAWVSREDLGEGTAKMLAEGGFENKTVLLSGPKAYTLTELAALLSSTLSKPVTLRVVSPDAYVAKHERPGGDVRSSADFLRLWALTYPALAAGECARVDPLLPRLLGRAPKPFEQSVRESLGDAAGGKGAIEQYAK